MQLGARLGAALQIMPGEGRLVRLVLAYGLLLGLGRMFCASAVSGLFLARFGAEALPYTFLGTALVVPVTGLGYLGLQGRVPLARLIAGTLVALLVALLAFRLALGFGRPAALVMALMIGYTTVYVLVTLIFWGLAGQLFDLRQAKRLFGLLGSGSEVGDITGGLLTLLIAPLIGAPNLLLLSVAGFGGALLVERLIVARHPLSAEQARAASGEPAPGVGAALRGGFVRGILVMLALSQLGYFFVETIFYDLALDHFAGADQLSGLVGGTVAASSILTILLQVTVAGRWLSRFGVRGGLPVLPALLTCGAAGVAVGGTLLGATFGVFTLMLFTRVLERAVRFSLDESAVQIAYQPIPAAQRSLVQTVVDGGVRPLAAGLAGALILAATRLVGLGGVQLAYLLVLIALAWLGMALAVGRGYGAALLQALGWRRLGGADLQLRDAASLAIVRRGLSSPYAGEALYALQLLEELEPPDLAGDLAALLRHPEPAVRREALRRAEHLALPGLAEPVRALLATEAQPAVRGQALSALAALGAAEPALLQLALADPAPEVQLGAAAALARTGETAQLQAWLRSRATGRPDERTLAARALGALRQPVAAELLRGLLADELPGVRQAALAAVVDAHVPLWPEVVAALHHPATHGAALAALSKGGDAAALALDEACAAEGPTLERRIALAQGCAAAGPGAAGPLLRWLDDPAEPVRHAVAVALDQSGYRAEGAQAEAVRRQIGVEAAYAAWALAARRDLEGGAAIGEPLRGALAGAARRARERALALVATLVERDALERARAGLAHEGAEQQAYGVEMLDLLLPPGVRPLVLALVEPPSPEQTLAQLERHAPQPRCAAVERPAEILADEGRHHPWVVACARHAAGLDDAGLVERVGLLKGGSIFAELAEEDLLEVALLLRAELVAANTAIFARGDTADCAYIIAGGAVRIHDGERTLNTLAPREMFGELAVLDGRPRALSASTLAATELLRLDREALLALLASHVSMARGVIRVLIRNLRVNLRELEATASREA